MSENKVWTIVNIIFIVVFVMTVFVMKGAVSDARDEGYKEGYEAALYEHGIDE